LQPSFQNSSLLALWISSAPEPDFGQVSVVRKTGQTYSHQACKAISKPRYAVPQPYFMEERELKSLGKVKEFLKEF
jgi:hypothetical protein